MASATCRTCHRSADAGAYCNSCAADIMANSLSPYDAVRHKKFPGRQEKLPRGVEGDLDGSP